MTWWHWLLIILAAGWIFFYQLWLHYLAVMALKRAMDKGELKPWAKFIGVWQVLPNGVALDWLGNQACIVIFFDLPGKVGELITGRLQRYADQAGDGRRKRWALAFARQMLNDFDPSGQHVKEGDTSNG